MGMSIRDAIRRERWAAAKLAYDDAARDVESGRHWKFPGQYGPSPSGARWDGDGIATWVMEWRWAHGWRDWWYNCYLRNWLQRRQDNRDLDAIARDRAKRS